MNWHDIPSLSALRGFEAAARCGSFSAAARELNVTHAAISQHVRGLEAGLGVKLVERAGQGIALTLAGTQLAAALSDGFEVIAAGVGRARRRSSGALRLALTATFAETWLMPRIGDFWGRNPEICVELVPNDIPVDLHRGDFDLAIRFGRGDWPDVEIEPLVGADNVIVASPAHAKQFAGLPVAKLTKARWLIDARHREQASWAAQIGLELSEHTLTTLPTLTMAIQAVRAGSGLTVVPRVLVERDIELGALVELAREEKGESNACYYIVTRPEQDSNARRKFIHWLREIAG